METYTIKPLEWRDGEICSTADTVFGEVEVHDGWVSLPDSIDGELCNSRDHGKELAWEWYKAKLGEALTRVD